jgi:hypothetical protein
MKRLIKLLTALGFCALLAACERPAVPAKVSAGSAEAVKSAPVADKKTVSALPEHFDRVRDEQYEKEEDRLRQRDRNN